MPEPRRRCGWIGPSPWRCRSHRLPRGSLWSPQTYQGFRAPPPLRVKGSVPTMSKGVCGLLSWESDSQVTYPFQYYTNFCSKSRCRQSMSSLFETNLEQEKKSRRKERWRNDFNKAWSSVPRQSRLSSRFAFRDLRSLAWSVLGTPS